MTKRTGRRRGHPGIIPYEQSTRMKFKIAVPQLERLRVRCAELGMSQGQWLRLVIENALVKVPRERSEASIWLGEQLVEERPPLIAEVNRAVWDARRHPGPPRCLP